MATRSGFYSADNSVNKQSKAIQQRIGQGMDYLDALFHGGSYGVNPLSEKQYQGLYNPNKPGPMAPYYTSGGQPWQEDEGYKLYMQKQAGRGGGSPFGPPRDDISTTKYGKFLAKQGNLFTGTESLPGFGQDFYDQAAKAYTNYAMPQLLSQYDDARRSMDYNLSDRGLFGGSAARQQVEKLNNQAVLQRQGIANEGINRANNLQKSVEEQYALLANQLQQSTDPARVTQQALQTASQFSVPSYSGPIGQLFGNFSNQFLANQLGGQYGRLAGTNAGTYGRPGQTTVKPISYNA